MNWKFWQRKPEPSPAPVPPPPSPVLNGLRIAAEKARAQVVDRPQYPVQPPALPKGVVPTGEKAPVLAMDQYGSFDYGMWGGAGIYGVDFTGFPGYPKLAQLATRAEYRAFASALSKEITREWITITSTESDDTTTKDKIRLLNEAVEKSGLRDAIQQAAEHDSYFGRGQILTTILSPSRIPQNRALPLILSDKTIPKGSTATFKAVEAMWTTPVSYNSIDPGAPNFYKPDEWFMLGIRVHATRLDTIITRPLPDMLKPAFNFSGMSLSQLAEPYVNNWLRTRQSVADIVNQFSLTVLATAMGQVLQGGDDGSDLMSRLDLFTATRSNKGVMAVDKETEEITQVNTPLSTLDALQSQSQEHLCTVGHMPSVVLLGVEPAGLNVSSEGTMAAWRDWNRSEQETHYRKPIQKGINVLQFCLFGEIDPRIGFIFNPLTQMTPEQKATIRLTNSNADKNYVDSGAIMGDEVREKLAADPESGYHGIDVNRVIETPEDDNDPDEPEGASDSSPYLASDVEFNEADHPRQDDGKFGSGGGGKTSSASKEKKQTLSSNEQYAIEHYVAPSDSSTGFLNLNKSLRSGGELSSDQKKQVERLDSALSKSPKFEGRTFRGVRFNSEEEKQSFLDSHKEGAEVETKQYLSTSKNSSVASGSVRIVIEGKNGADISGISKDATEQEVLYPRNSRFTVTKVAKDSKGGTIIGMREI